MGLGSILPGLRLTLPRGWRSTENDQGELSLVPPRYPNERLLVWLDMHAVKSTGAGHGKVLPKVGTTADALISWLERNPDFQTISGPAPSTLIHGIKTTRLVLGVSRSAHYGDRECPSNPRCAALFTNTTYWGPDFYAIGAPEETQLYVGAIRREGVTHNFIVALDAEGARQMGRLTAMATPIIASLRLPSDTVGA